ncbi:uncharacterized protein LOC118468176 [Anopheles albimanus]|uniref:uncharacterized protein LOC118468176 n=1 Tax=Anopheles albimanus TaxID=7167 RepID=UPI0016409471|nr:uncharacterized protein LOC118468176 [Anopheles albimanus]
MAAVCHSCNNDLAPSDGSVVCCYCEAEFHLSCTKVPINLLQQVLQFGELHWSCIGCSAVLRNPCSRSAKMVGLHVGFQAALSSAVQVTKETILDPLIAEIRSGHSVANVESTPVGGKSIDYPADQPRKRRRVFDLAPPTSASKSTIIGNINSYASVTRLSSMPAAVIGTNNQSSPIVTVAPPLASVARCWIHLSRFANVTTVEQVTKLVQRNLETDDVMAYCLLRKGASPDSVHSLSYKVRIPLAYREKALSASTWPVGVGVRVFIQTDHLRPLRSSPVRVRSSPTRVSPTRVLEADAINRSLDGSLENNANSTLVEGPQCITENYRNKRIPKHQTTLDTFFRT